MLPGFSLRCFDEITLQALHIIKDYKSFSPEWFQYNKCFLIHGCCLEDWVHDWMACCSTPSADEGVSADAKLYTLDAAATMYYYRKRLMTTTEGGFGMAPHNSQPGGEVWVLFGCSVPVVHPASGMSLLGRVMPMALWTGRRLPSMRKKRGRRGWWLSNKCNWWPCTSGLFPCLFELPMSPVSYCIKVILVTPILNCFIYKLEQYTHIHSRYSIFLVESKFHPN